MKTESNLQWNHFAAPQQFPQQPSPIDFLIPSTLPFQGLRFWSAVTQIETLQTPPDIKANRNAVEQCRHASVRILTTHKIEWTSRFHGSKLHKEAEQRKNDL